jgi:hypothetical protein
MIAILVMTVTAPVLGSAPIEALMTHQQTYAGVDVMSTSGVRPDRSGDLTDQFS